MGNQPKAGNKENIPPSKTPEKGRLFHEPSYYYTLKTLFRFQPNLYKKAFVLFIIIFLPFTSVSSIDVNRIEKAKRRLFTDNFSAS